MKLAEGSVQQMDELPADLKQIYRTVWEIPKHPLPGCDNEKFDPEAR